MSDHPDITTPVASPIDVSVIGASGYSGAELLRLLSRHPYVRIVGAYANSSVGMSVADLYPRDRGVIDMRYDHYDIATAAACDLAFIALPSGQAMGIVPELRARGVRVIDLGGDFRLKDPERYRAYYRRDHTAPELLSEAVYGLSEWNRVEIVGAGLIANPGCYPTGALLPLAPLLRDGAIDPAGITISSMSGISGAGRSSVVDLSYTEMFGNVRAYRAPDHQHVPEIESALADAAGKAAAVTFIPHLIPVARGIHTTVVASLQRTVTSSDVAGVFEAAYGGDRLIRWSESALPAITSVVNTSFIDIGFRIDPRTNRLMLFSAIDNLLKGAAGQAVQNMNIVFGFPELEGLL